MKRQSIFAAAGLCVAALFSGGTASAKTAPVYTGTFSHVAVSGYDPVAYFTEGHPVKGSDKFTFDYSGATWRFASAASRDAFKANPARYAPQFGGYCAWAVGHGYTASGDPSVWRIVDGKLYLNYNAEIGRRWSQDIPNLIKAGNANWPKLVGG